MNFLKSKIEDVIFIDDELSFRDDLKNALFDYKENIEDLIYEIKSNPSVTINALECWIEKIEDRLLKNGYCPECGEELETNMTSRGNYYNAPEYETGCSNCGYTVD